MKTVILAAGFGSRLWPLSTSEKPKQFLPLVSDQSLLAYTYGQLAKTTAVSDLYALTLHGLEHLVQTELPNIDPDHILAVPERRNTLPHTLWALTQISDSPDEPVLFKSVDHFIRNPGQFASSLQQCLARYDRIQPAITLLCTAYTRFNSNDGYCIVDDSRHILKFLEKPTIEQLQGAADQSKIYRNTCVYIASVHTCFDILNDIEEAWVDTAMQLLSSDAVSRKEVFLRLPMLDITYAIFQKTRRLMLDEIEYDFVDIGRFEEIYEINSKDDHGNVVIGNVLLGTACHNSLFINKLTTPLVVLSTNNAVVVQTIDGSLVAPFKDAAKIGEIYKSRVHNRQ